MNSPEQLPIFTNRDLHHGWRSTFDQKDVHGRGIKPLPQDIQNYLKIQNLRTPRNTRVAAPLLYAIVPTTTVDLAQTIQTGETQLVPKPWHKLSSDTVQILQQAQQTHGFTYLEIQTEADFYNIANQLGFDQQYFFNQMAQTDRIILLSEWVGPNIPQFLSTPRSPEVQQRVGQYLGQTVRALHQSGLTLGDNDQLTQFVVRGEVENVERVDLVHFFDENQQQAAQDLMYILEQYSREAAQAFHEAYRN